jgi:hypothetical protein
VRKEEARSWEIGLIARHPDMGTLEDKVAPDPDNRRPVRRIHTRLLAPRQGTHGATVTRKSYFASGAGTGDQVGGSSAHPHGGKHFRTSRDVGGCLAAEAVPVDGDALEGARPACTPRRTLR